MPHPAGGRIAFPAGALVAVLLALTGCVATRRAAPRRLGVATIEHVGGSTLLGIETQRTRRSNAQDRHEVLLKEIQRIEVAGNLYDRRLLRFLVDGSLGLTQTDLSDDGNGFRNQILPGYDATLRILPEHPYPLTLFASRYEDRILSQASESAFSLQTLSETLGGRVDLRWPALRGNLSFLRSLVETESLLQNRRESRTSYEVLLEHASKSLGRTRLQILREDSSTGPIGQDYTTDRLILSNTLELGTLTRRPRAVIRTGLNSWRRTGGSREATLQGTEDLLWRLTENLESQTHYAFTSLTGSVSTRRHEVSQTFIHRLYKSLTTTLEGDFSTEEVEDGRVLRGGGSLLLDYRKQTRLGLLTLGYSYAWNRQDNALGLPPRRTVDEAHTLSTTTFVLLENKDVDTGSVVVVRSSDGVVMTEGIDYRLVVRGRDLQLVLIPGGGIPEGGNVLVSYTFSSPGDFAFDTFGQSLSAQVQILKIARVYVRAERRRQALVRGTAVGVLENLDALTLGGDATWGPLRLLLEYTDHDSNLSPFRQMREELSYATTWGPRAQLGASAADLRVSFPDGDDLRVDSFQATIRLRPRRGFVVIVEPGYRIERGRGSDRDTFTLRADMSYTWGDLSLHLAARYEREKLTERTLSDTYTIFTLEKKW